ncbi:formate dehydrogenase subunit gamma [Jiella sp. MQZ9-1]|uniref:Formate dehydrogenase subunit gamma n=1 Tax=Jiella flava TaxID=2816857 RepID=A0A939FYL5_9HYPH|nr:formate dehydrogenase subunit gamma [Jiella flava]MBO0663264.1 formate dehydrogenase subunit gamma [Jiella flava]MCD2471840.1 formate dehydrogenase subunit gamma [Jiella flava]
MVSQARYDEAEVAELIEERRGLEGPMLPILHAIQARFGHVPDAAVRQIAAALNLTRAEVYGVVSFYHDFHKEPRGRHVLKVCRAEACQAAGGDRVAGAIEAALGIGFGETTPDGQVTLEAVYCLGLCATAPSAMLDRRVVGRLSESRVGALIEEARL